MKSRLFPSPLSTLGGLFALLLLGLLTLPLVGLFFSSSIEDIKAGLDSPLFVSALTLSFKTSLLSLILTVILGTPLAWWLARTHSKWAKIIAVLVELPIVVPPAVVGVGLLSTFGQNGLMGEALNNMGISLPFTTYAVVLAQTVVSAPFYIQAAVNAFSKVDSDTIIVARSLGASPESAFLKVAIPIAGPGLIVGASLAWARALGEFGATLLFAGNLATQTQTMPLAIFSALESNVQLAIVYSMVLAATGILLLLSMRWILPLIWRNNGKKNNG